MTAVTVKAWPQTTRFQRPEAPMRSRLDARPAIADEAIDWSHAAIGELVDHLLTAHHAALGEALPALSERTAALIEAHPVHAEPARVLLVLLERLNLHMRKLEQVLYPLLRRVDAGKHGDVLVARLIGPDALDLAADAEAIQADLDALRQLARRCPDPGTASAARKLDDRARRFLRLEADVLLPRAAMLSR